MVCVFEARFGIDRDLCREVVFESRNAANPDIQGLYDEMGLRTDPYLDRASGPESRGWHAQNPYVARL